MKIFEVTNPESFEELNIDDLKQIAKLIKQDCKTICNEINLTGHYLYRGVGGLYGNFYIGNSPINRQPKATSPKISNLLDQKLIEAGFQALRSNSIFVTSDKFQASEYGSTIYRIFPKDGFNFTWCRDAKDLTINFYLSYNNYDPNDFKKNLNAMEAIEFCNRYGFSNENLTRAMMSENEIYISGSYFLINDLYFRNNKLKNLLFAKK